ncbi:Fasciclin-like arabinogalactan protein 8 [Abeliophyllum distichum]|uniref:Fasciclin-like arabinogalactan protein 8 n=1 Tax=Abeliophyllum distichum TaxID=126358 RepID=A0ABD1NPF1_9LAMI
MNCQSSIAISTIARLLQSLTILRAFLSTHQWDNFLLNGALSSITGKHPLSVVKNELALHVLLDYFDAPKLHKISDGSTLSTTLYQTTGNAPGNLGLSTLLFSRVAKSASAQGFQARNLTPPTPNQSTKCLTLFLFSRSARRLMRRRFLNAPAPKASDVNITGLLEKAGCKTFASLIVSTGVLKFYQSAIDKGLTIFAVLRALQHYPYPQHFDRPPFPSVPRGTRRHLSHKRCWGPTKTAI